MGETSHPGWRRCLWGMEKRWQERVGEEATFLHLKRRHFSHRSCSLQHAADGPCNHSGPAVTALEALDPVARERLAQDMRALFEQAMQARDGTGVGSGFLPARLDLLKRTGKRTYAESGISKPVETICAAAGGVLSPPVDG
jgi:hypothetical protein